MSRKIVSKCGAVLAMSLTIGLAGPSEAQSSSDWYEIADGVWESVDEDGVRRRSGSGRAGLEFVLEETHQRRGVLAEAGADLAQVDALLDHLEQTLISVPKSGPSCGANFTFNIDFINRPNKGKVTTTASHSEFAPYSGYTFDYYTYAEAYARQYGYREDADDMTISNWCCGSVSSRAEVRPSAYYGCQLYGFTDLTVTNGCNDYEFHDSQMDCPSMAGPGE